MDKELFLPFVSLNRTTISCSRAHSGLWNVCVRVLVRARVAGKVLIEFQN